MLYFSKSLYGFYDDTIHKEIPKDAIKITQEQHAILMSKTRDKIIDVIDGVVQLVDRIITYEEQAQSIRQKRDELISAIEWRVGRYNNEITLELLPTEDILPVLQYMQELRDVTKQQDFPFNIVWPKEPIMS